MVTEDELDWLYVEIYIELGICSLCWCVLRFLCDVTVNLWDKTWSSLSFSPSNWVASLHHIITAIPKSWNTPGNFSRFLPMVLTCFYDGVLHYKNMIATASCLFSLPILMARVTRQHLIPDHVKDPIHEEYTRILNQHCWIMKGSQASYRLLPVTQYLISFILEKYWYTRNGNIGVPPYLLPSIQCFGKLKAIETSPDFVE